MNTRSQDRTASDADTTLEVRHVSLSFGGIKALRDVSLKAAPAEVTSIIGPNGAGKTSLLNTISGFYKPQEGDVLYGGENLLERPAWRRAGDGIARTFQNIALFPGLSVIENIKLGAHSTLKTNVFGAAFYLGRARREERELTAWIEENLIDFLGLRSVIDTPVDSLPYGVQKRVELARALVSDAQLLLLDEPVAGMNSVEKAEMADAVRQSVDRFGTTVVLIEHDMQTVMKLSSHIVCLNFGEVIARGTGAEIRENPRVIEAYLGTKSEAAS